MHKMQNEFDENKRTDKDRTELLSKQIAKLQADCRELVEQEKRSKEAVLQVEGQLKEAENEARAQRENTIAMREQLRLCENENQALQQQLEENEEQ